MTNETKISSNRELLVESLVALKMLAYKLEAEIARINKQLVESNENKLSD